MRAVLNWSLVNRLAGPLIAAAMLSMSPPGDLDLAAWQAAAVAVWMAWWWMTEAVPVPVTALLPIAMFPLLGVGTLKSVTASYAHPIIYLFLGGFSVALAVQRWKLHERIALAVLVHAGRSSRSLVAGFMLAAALISMWVTNTATTMMLLPIALAVIAVVGSTLPDLSESEQNNFKAALVLGVAYSATIGGMATLIGTPPNALLAGFMADNFGLQISFASWLAVGGPMTVTLLPLCWLLLTRLVFPTAFIASPEVLGTLRGMRARLGRMSVEEKRVSVVFVLMALAWVCRPLLVQLPGLANLSDQSIAVIAAISLFLIPATDGGRLLRWEDARDLPWGILLLFGGGLALAAAVSETGLAQALGEGLAGMGLSDIIALTVLVALLIVFLTELTSNLATTATFLPVVTAIATHIGHEPMILAVPATLAASCAFMLPVATAPNAIAYASGAVSIRQMMRAGMALNLIGTMLVVAIAWLLVPALFSSQ